MRIGLIITQLRNGGGPYQLLHLAQELRKARHDVIIYTLHDTVSTIEPQLVKGLTIKSCHFDGKVESRPHSQVIGFILYLFYLLKINYMLGRLVMKDKLDIVNPHEWPVHWAAVLVKWVRDVPIVWMCNDVWQIPDYKQYSETRIVFKIGDRLVLAPIDVFFTLFVDVITVLDHRITAITGKYYHKKPIVVRSGIDLTKFKVLPSKVSIRKKLGLPEDAFIFLCLSIFFPHRRFEDAIMAFKKIRGEIKNKDSKLFIVGSDAYDNSYARDIRKLILKNALTRDVIIKTDYMKEDMVYAYIAACDAFVFPNEKQTWGLIVVEAMASGKACIVSNEAGVHEIIEHEKNGLVFKVRNVSSLARNMKRVANNTTFAKIIGENARKYVFGNLSWKHYCAQMMRVYENCLFS